MADVPVAEEDLMIWFDLIDSIELDANAPEDLKTKLADAIQSRNNYGQAQAPTAADNGTAAPA
jgi:hypothetical protein